MDSTQNFKDHLIQKILSTDNIDLLRALDDMISNRTSPQTINLTQEQIDMLQMSNQDIQAGRTMDQSTLDKIDLEWLNAQ